METKRTSNFELLRIICMILIIAHHYSVHGGWSVDNTFSFNRVFVQILSLGGKLGVNCFVLISGYFLVDSEFKLRKLIKIWGEVFFYSILILIVSVFFVETEVGMKQIIKAVFPTIYSDYWFATTYIALYILHPFLNKLIKSISCAQYRMLLILLFILLSFIPTFFVTGFIYTNIGWFVFLYLIAAYIKLYPLQIIFCKTKLLFGAIISYALIILSVIVFDLIGTKITIFSQHATYFSQINKFPLLICSVCLFAYFKHVDIGSKRWLNKISLTTFGIYLIHDNNIARSFIWINISQNPSFYYSEWLVIHAILVIGGVFVVCMLIDFIRLYFVEKPLSTLVDKKCDSLQYKIGKNFN